jgi:hypothetical protein
MEKQENMAVLLKMDKKPGWSFYIGWILLTSLSMLLAYAVVFFLLRFAISLIGDYIYVNGVRHITEDYLALYFLVPVMALLSGAVQYMLLRLYLPRMGWWVPATVGGWLLGMLLVSLLIQVHWMDPSNIELTFLLLGLAIGCLQWLVLMRRLPRAGWWIAASMLGWALLLLFTSGNSIGQEGLFFIGFFPASATAMALVLLFRQLPGSVSSPG